MWQLPVEVHLVQMEKSGPLLWQGRHVCVRPWAWGSFYWEDLVPAGFIKRLWEISTGMHLLCDYIYVKGASDWLPDDTEKCNTWFNGEVGTCMQIYILISINIINTYITNEYISSRNGSQWINFNSPYSYICIVHYIYVNIYVTSPK